MNKDLTRWIKNKAFEIGFSKIGIAPCEPLKEEGEHLVEWLRRKYHGEMKWMEEKKEVRIDPRKILPSAKSILSVAYNYYVPIAHADDDEHGKISRYAWGKDYHTVVKEKLIELLQHIQTRVPECEGKVYVDTGPVMEKAWAMRAGIGWIGKNTNILTREYGSWVFLGEILLNLELEYDTPATDFCGTCTACIQACPTQALVNAYVLDATRCISYLTIEQKGEIPPKLGENFRNWVFGCDICQDVCPWNRFAKPTTEESFYPSPQNIAPLLVELAAITEEEFSRRFKGTPVKRAKYSGFLRNVKTVLALRKTQNL